MAHIPTRQRGCGRPPIRAWRASDCTPRDAIGDSHRLAQMAFCGAGDGSPRATLTRAIRNERLKAASLRQGYDVGRHAALARALRGLAKSGEAPRR